MSFEADEDILQDFLVEAGEILEQLSEQLVDLENNPEDSALLNAIFRGFHTVKGGAGFLQLDALVNCCHSAENVFDTLRNQKRQVTSELMDTVLEALDHVNSMFDEVRARENPTAAPDELIAALDALALPADQNPQKDVPESASEAAEEMPLDDAPQAGDESDTCDPDNVTQAHVDKLQAVIRDDSEYSQESDPAIDSSAPGDITDDEFEALLDQLHGKGQFTGPVETEKSEPKAAQSNASDEISDDEFEALLDDLHGKGGGPTSGAKEEAPSQSKPEALKPPAEKPKATAKPAREQQPQAEASVRVDTKRLDDIMNMVGELVLVRNRLNRIGSGSEDEELQKAVANLDVVTGDLQTSVMQTRMQPIKKVFGRFPRVVRDLARSLKKEINLVMHGEDTDLDKNLVEALSDPLVHLVRNSVDHGIEAPDVREEAGKPRTGTVTLSAQQEGDHILLVIEDDGAGMDPDVLRRKAVEKGIYDQEAADRLTNTECYNLIFAAGFSTKEQISDVSGRGVGMDVVKTKISQLNGQINIESELGKGSRILIKVPLTLAIMPTLMIGLGDQSFALPLVNVVEIFNLDLSRANMVDGRECIVVREKVYPLFHIKRWLVNGPESQVVSSSAHVVIVTVGTKQIGFVVDHLIGQEEVVIKPLGKALQGTPGMAGATITGDGRIALIIDIPSLLQHYT